MKVPVTCTVNKMETGSLIVPLPSYSRHDKERLGWENTMHIETKLVATLFQ